MGDQDAIRIKYLCDTEAKRAEGLMHKPELHSGECAFFVFQYPQPLSFWNKNVDFDICVFFADENHKVKCHGTLRAGQESPLRSCGTAKYVIEVPMKDSEKIQDGDVFVQQGQELLLVKEVHKAVFESQGFQKIANEVYKTVR